MLGSVGETAFTGVVKEPVLSKGYAEMLADGSIRVTEGRQADLAIRGLWEPQEFAFIDVSVVDTDAKTFVKQKPMDVLTQREERKVDHYNATVETEQRNILSVHSLY